MGESWNLDDTITEPELSRQSKLGAITQMTIRQTPEGYCVLIRLKWHRERLRLGRGEKSMRREFLRALNAWSISFGADAPK